MGAIGPFDGSGDVSVAVVQQLRREIGRSNSCEMTYFCGRPGHPKTSAGRSPRQTERRRHVAATAAQPAAASMNEVDKEGLTRRRIGPTWQP